MKDNFRHLYHTLYIMVIKSEKYNRRYLNFLYK